MGNSEEHACGLRERKLWQPCAAIAFAMTKYSMREYKYYFLLFLEI
ncbi:hypothetical protein YSA_09842 [Pseudomonas putida ND6]|uniref:Uncharacterized protein n=1 Tax=Pseudomonas putida ND6 TaxID=231023 RepID=I3V2Z3_PSEPU|nr:hypothetical protein YSA_09842 [Pseudomonas putida ND6]